MEKERKRLLRRIHRGVLSSLFLMKSESGILLFLTFPVSTLQQKNKKNSTGCKSGVWNRKRISTLAVAKQLKLSSNKISGFKIWLKLLNCSDVFTKTKALITTHLVCWLSSSLHLRLSCPCLTYLHRNTNL